MSGIVAWHLSHEIESSRRNNSLLRGNVVFQNTNNCVKSITITTKSIKHAVTFFEIVFHIGLFTCFGQQIRHHAPVVGCICVGFGRCTGQLWRSYQAVDESGSHGTGENKRLRSKVISIIFRGRPRSKFNNPC